MVVPLDDDKPLLKKTVVRKPTNKKWLDFQGSWKTNPRSYLMTSTSNLMARYQRRTTLHHEKMAPLDHLQQKKTA